MMRYLLSERDVQLHQTFYTSASEAVGTPEGVCWRVAM